MQGFLVLSLLLAATAGSSEQKKDETLQAAVETRVAVVEQWAADPVIVGAVRRANDDERSMSEIQAIDAKWQQTTGVDEFMRTIIDHPAAERLRDLRTSTPELQEAFLTDRRGANVAATNKTSDFYQGDETKFTEAFNGGAGGVHIGNLERDESIQSYSMHIGVPVLDQGEAIGVLVVTVNVEKLKQSMGKE